MPTYRVIWHLAGWWHEEKLTNRDAAEALAIDKSLEHRTEARLFGGGQRLGTWRKGERVEECG